MYTLLDIENITEPLNLILQNLNNRKKYIIKISPTNRKPINIDELLDSLIAEYSQII